MENHKKIRGNNDEPNIKNHNAFFHFVVGELFLQSLKVHDPECDDNDTDHDDDGIDNRDDDDDDDHKKNTTGVSVRR